MRNAGLKPPVRLRSRNDERRESLQAARNRELVELVNRLRVCPADWVIAKLDRAVLRPVLWDIFEELICAHIGLEEPVQLKRRIVRSSRRIA